MRTLHISFSSNGGAAKSARNLVKLQNSKGDESFFHSLIDGPLVNQMMEQPAIALAAFLDNFVISNKKMVPLFSLLRNHINADYLPSERLGQLDVIHLHWPVGLLNKAQTPQLGNTKSKLVITLHDDFSFTGGCHNAGTCKDYQNECKACPIVRRPFRKLVHEAYKQKQEAVQRISPGIIAPSDLILKRARNSGILQNLQIVKIFNPLETEYLEAPITEPEILNVGRAIRLGFVASNPLDPNKGLRRLFEISSTSTHRIEIDVVGSLGGKSASGFPSFVRYVGPCTAKQIAVLAQNWDALVIFSRNETAPMVLCEMALLGVPTLGLNSGAIQEFVNELGFGEVLDQDFSQEQFDRTIMEITRLNQVGTRKINAANARKLFNLDEIYMKTLDLYRNS